MEAGNCGLCRRQQVMCLTRPGLPHSAVLERARAEADGHNLFVTRRWAPGRDGLAPEAAVRCRVGAGTAEAGGGGRPPPPTKHLARLGASERSRASLGASNAVCVHVEQRGRWLRRVNSEVASFSLVLISQWLCSWAHQFRLHKAPTHLRQREHFVLCQLVATT